MEFTYPYRGIPSDLRGDSPLLASETQWAMIRPRPRSIYSHAQNQQENASLIGAGVVLLLNIETASLISSTMPWLLSGFLVWLRVFSNLWCPHRRASVICNSEFHPLSQAGDITPGTCCPDRNCTKPIFSVPIWTASELSAFVKFSCNFGFSLFRNEAACAALGSWSWDI